MALAECGTHAVLDAAIGPCTTSKIELSRELAGRFTPGMLVLADRGSYGFQLWAQAAATGADLLWRVKTNLRPPVTVRVIEYTIADGREPAEPFWLVTTIMDHTEASAIELAAAYAQRWEVESGFDELKTHQRGPRMVMRSKSPDLVRQEIWGHLCCDYAIRTLMVDAALHARRDPDRVSFVAALRIARRSVAQGAFPPPRPDYAAAIWRHTVLALVRRLNPARRRRSNPRVIKRKISKWRAKRLHHAHWSQPLHAPEITPQTLN